MAAFTISYRLPSGGLKSEVIDAADRASALAQMKARGITPVSVKEGGTIATAAKVAAKQPAWIKGAIAGLVVVIAAVIAFFCLMPTEKPATPKVEKPRKVKVERPQTGSREKIQKSDPVIVSEELIVTNRLDFQSTYPRKPGHLPLPGGNVITFTPPAPGCTAQVFTVGGLYLCDSEGNFTKYEPPRLFDNRFENTIESLAMNTRLLLTSHTKNFSNAEIAMYLARPITINADDSKDVVERKTATAAMKEEIKAFIKEGGTYQEYIDQLHQKIGNERSLHREAMREMVNLMAEGDVEGAREYRDKINEFLSEKGYLGLKLPEEWQKQLDAAPEVQNDSSGDTGSELN